MPETMKGSYRFGPETVDVLERLARHLGLSKAATIRFCIRRVAQQEGLKLPDAALPRDD